MAPQDGAATVSMRGRAGPARWPNPPLQRVPLHRAGRHARRLANWPGIIITLLQYQAG